MDLKRSSEIKQTQEKTRTEEASEPGHVPYLSMLGIINTVKHNSYHYMEWMTRLWDNEFSLVLRLATVMLLALLAILGHFVLLKRKS